MKATAIAPSNIAFIKYWGRKDEAIKLPANGSISINLSALKTTTTVEFSTKYNDDETIIDGTNKTDERVRKHIDRIRELANISEKAKVVSDNSFPQGTGLSSSASGFAALTMAATKAAGLNLSEKELSILARHGSGSACRSIPDGFVEWLDGETSETSYAHSLYPQDYWDIVDIVCVLTDTVKDVSTTEGQKLAKSSPFWETRQENIREKIAKIKTYLKDKNFKEFGELVEAEALEMHAIMLTSHPSLIYWYPATITVMKAVQKWRREGLDCYFTINTGQNIHVLCLEKDQGILEEKLRALPETKEIILNTPAGKTELTSTHLF